MNCMPVAVSHETESLFAAEAAYADSIFRTALGDSQGCIDALRRSMECMPTYAPALLSFGTVEYQQGHQAKGWNLFMKLFELPDDTKDLCVIIDKAGDFLIQLGRYEDGLALYRRAATRFPAHRILTRVRVAVPGTKACTAKLYRRHALRSHWNPTIRSLSMIWAGRYTKLAASKKPGLCWNALFRWTKMTNWRPKTFVI